MKINKDHCWNYTDRGKPKYSDTLSLCPQQISRGQAWKRSTMPVTNRLSNGTAMVQAWKKKKKKEWKHFLSNALRFPKHFLFVEIYQQRVYADEYGALIGWQWQRKTEVLGEKCLNDIPSTTTLTQTALGSNPGFRGEFCKFLQIIFKHPVPAADKSLLRSYKEHLANASWEHHRRWLPSVERNMLSVILKKFWKVVKTIYMPPPPPNTTITADCREQHGSESTIVTGTEWVNYTNAGPKRWGAMYTER